MRNFVFLLLSLCLFFQSLQAASLFDFSPTSTTIEGEVFPRNGRLQYRGTRDAQLSPAQAIRGLFGKPEILVESLFFATIKNQLMGNNFPWATPLNSFLNGEIRELREHGNLKEQDAIRESVRLVDETLQYMTRRNQVIPQYLDYSSDSFVDWPRDIVFTTLVSPAAATYGDRMIVIREKTPKSLDLNFWNKAKNNTWFLHTRDVAEFVSFGYIAGESLFGYQVRQGPEKSWHQIRWAMYKTSNPNVLVVLSGQRPGGGLSACIDFNPQDQSFYHCNYAPGTLALKVPSLSDDLVATLGYFVRCAKGSECRLPADLRQPRGASTSVRGDLSEIKNLEFEDRENVFKFIEAR